VQARIRTETDCLIAVVVCAAQDQIDARAPAGQPLAQTLMDRIELAPVDDATRHLGLVDADDTRAPA